MAGTFEKNNIGIGCKKEICEIATGTQCTRSSKKNEYIFDEKTYKWTPR